MGTPKANRRPHPSDGIQLEDVEGLHDCRQANGGGRIGGYCKIDGGGSLQAAATQLRESKTFHMVWLVVAFLSFPALVFVSGVYRLPLTYVSTVVFPQSGSGPSEHPQLPAYGSQDDAFYGPSDVPRDKYLGGLLPEAGFDEESCLSRYKSPMYRKPSHHRPSPYLVERLRRYEVLHRRCSPHTAAYNKTLPLLTGGGGGDAGAAECKYLVWTPYNGLGNNILTMTSAFVYALLSDRVLLIDRGKDFDDLFCEPFPGGTWLVPLDFPIDFSVFEWKNNQSYGNMLRYHSIGYADGAAAGPLPNFIYAHLTHDYDDNDKRFFCEPDQAVLGGIPWMVLKSDSYLVPAFFLNRRFEPELSRLFPEKDTVFHHIGRYLFHPSNAVWGMITRYYEAYLARNRERLGIQVRVFNFQESPLDLVAEQVINCTLTEGLLPGVDAGRALVDADPNKTKAVLVASLYPQSFDRIKNMYWEHPAAGGTIISVHQPSHEEAQLTGRERHDLKVLAEMYLLSYADVLVTSAWSTFGYVAQGLAGVRPWILVRPHGAKMPEPACVRDVSMDPCCHKPPWYDCKECKSFTDPGKEVPYVTHCMDVEGGIKIIDVGNKRK
ncbi:hypothetical protein Taro_021638 [Colocasia esculenta]|uniref:Fucosyltransferase n=1 Tax=Colocasia esculenta TaxID=4460 RepID=A0A843V5Y9_COLES|nr:hypothetical protein [Colocasia esculenta]